MSEKRSVFTSFWFSLAFSIVSVLSVVDYGVTVLTENRSVIKIIALLGWIVIANYFIRTFLERLRERRQAK